MSLADILAAALAAIGGYFIGRTHAEWKALQRMAQDEAEERQRLRESLKKWSAADGEKGDQ